MMDKLVEKLFYYHDKYPSLCGRLYLILVSISTTGIFASSKLLTERHPLSVILYYVAILMVFFMYALSINYDVKQFVFEKPMVQFKLFLRGSIGSTNWLILTGGATLIPIKLVGVLMATNTFWGQVFDAFVVGIKITKAMILLVLTTFVGIVLVINPEVILVHFGVVYETSTDTAVYDTIFYIGICLCLFGTFLSVLINWIIADLSHSMHPIQNVFYFSIFCVWVSGLKTIFSGADSNWFIYDYFYLFIQFMSMLGLQHGLFFGNNLEKRLSYVSVLINLQNVWNFALAVQIWNDTILISNIVGAVLVVLSGVFIIISKENVKKVSKIENSKKLNECIDNDTDC